MLFCSGSDRSPDPLPVTFYLCMSRMYRFNPLLPERRSHALQKTHRIDYTTSHAVMRVKVIKYHDANVLLIPARDHVAVSSVCQGRALLRALFCREAASGAESAS